MSDLDKLKFIIKHDLKHTAEVSGRLQFSTPHGIFLIMEDMLDVIKERCAEGYKFDKPDGYVRSILAIGDYVLYKSVEPLQPTQNKYHRKLTASINSANYVKGDRVTITVDVYDVLKAFNVTDPALQHLIKKALCCGLRGHKDRAQDLQDILDSATRAKELRTDE